MKHVHGNQNPAIATLGCQLCPALYMSYISLAKHYLDIHQKKALSECRMCSTRTSCYPARMTNHLSHEHNGLVVEDLTQQFDVVTVDMQFRQSHDRYKIRSKSKELATTSTYIQLGVGEIEVESKSTVVQQDNTCVKKTEVKPNQPLTKQEKSPTDCSDITSTTTLSASLSVVLEAKPNEPSDAQLSPKNYVQFSEVNSNFAYDDTVGLDTGVTKCNPKSKMISEPVKNYGLIAKEFESLANQSDRKENKADTNLYTPIDPVGTNLTSPSEIINKFCSTSRASSDVSMDQATVITLSGKENEVSTKITTEDTLESEINSNQYSRIMPIYALVPVPTRAPSAVNTSYVNMDQSARDSSNVLKQDIRSSKSVSISPSLESKLVQTINMGKLCGSCDKYLCNNKCHQEAKVNLYRVDISRHQLSPVTLSKYFNVRNCPLCNSACINFKRLLCHFRNMHPLHSLCHICLQVKYGQTNSYKYLPHRCCYGISRSDNALKLPSAPIVRSMEYESKETISKNILPKRTEETISSTFIAVKSATKMALTTNTQTLVIKSMTPGTSIAENSENNTAITEDIYIPPLNLSSSLRHDSILKKGSDSVNFDRNADPKSEDSILCVNAHNPLNDTGVTTTKSSPLKVIDSTAEKSIPLYTDYLVFPNGQKNIQEPTAIIDKLDKLSCSSALLDDCTNLSAKHSNNEDKCVIQNEVVIANPIYDTDNSRDDTKNLIKDTGREFTPDSFPLKISREKKNFDDHLRTEHALIFNRASRCLAAPKAKLLLLNKTKEFNMPIVARKNISKNTESLKSAFTSTIPVSSLYDSFSGLDESSSSTSFKLSTQPAARLTDQDVPNMVSLVPVTIPTIPVSVGVESSVIPHQLYPANTPPLASNTLSSSSNIQISRSLCSLPQINFGDLQQQYALYGKLPLKRVMPSRIMPVKIDKKSNNTTGQFVNISDAKSGINPFEIADLMSNHNVASNGLAKHDNNQIFNNVQLIKPVNTSKRAFNITDAQSGGINIKIVPNTSQSPMTVTIGNSEITKVQTSLPHFVTLSDQLESASWRKDHLAPLVENVTKPEKASTRQPINGKSPQLSKNAEAPRKG